ncbi:MAG: DUF4190 domain-containing protein [Roseburia sp.]|nr:DUF4190 domain-containing protein [Roseburia sp.]MCM1097332.1 DUF4190 domain-containing protein [Ruminococcus flavefaciens]
MDGQNNYQDYTANTYQAPPVNPGSSGPNGCQIASLVLGILGIPGCCCYGVVGFLFGVVGLILAIVGNSKNKGNGIGIAGLVCSIIAIIFGIAAGIYYIAIVLGMMGSGPFAEMLEEMGYSMDYLYQQY